MHVPPYNRVPAVSSLLLLVAAAREAHIERAAASVELTPSALMHEIAALEALLGFGLFTRKRGVLELTISGARYLEVVDDCLSRLQDAQRELQARSGPLRLSTLASFSEQWLIPHLPEFARAHPEIELEIETTLRYDDFDRDPVDVAIRFGGGEWGELHAEPLFDTVALTVCSPALQRTLQKPDDLIDHTLIHQAQVPDAWSEWLAAAGVPDLRPRRHLRFDHVSGALTAAELGQGVALCAQLLCEPKLAEGKLVRPFEQALSMRSTYHFVCKRQSLRDARVIALRDWLVSSLRDQR